MKFKYIIIIIILFLVYSNLCEASLTLTEAESTCLENNKEILIKEKHVDYLKYRLKETWGIDFPDIQLSASRKMDVEATYYSVTLSSLTIDYINGRSEKAKAVKEYKNSILDLIVLKRNKTREVRILFQKHFLLKERLQYTQEVYDLTLEKLNKDKEKLKKGIILPLEKMESELRLNRDQLRISSIRSDMKKNLEDLKMLFGMDVNKKLEIIKPEPKAFDIDRAMKKILTAQPSIKFVENEIRFLKKIKKELYEPFIPDVSVFYIYSYDKWDKNAPAQYDGGPKPPGDATSWTVGLSLTIPLFDIITIFPKVKADKTLMKKLKLEKESAKEKLIFSLKKSYISYQLSREKVETTEKSFLIAKERLSLLNIQKEYKEISDYESQRAKNELDGTEWQLYTEKLDNLNKREELFYILGDYKE